MYLLDNPGMVDPEVNISIETYLLNNNVVDDTLLYFYMLKPSIGIGRYQNTYEEINKNYVEKHNIPVIRRQSGGGAAFSDLGQLAFCFITKDDGDSYGNFKKFTQPIIDALHEMGVKDAELKGRNDLVIQDKKFSGNAMYAKNGKIIAHGTLMLDVDIDLLTKVLTPKKEKLESKGVKSIRSRVTNIRPYLDEAYKELSINEFKEELILHIFNVKHRNEVKEYKLTEKDWEEINKIKDQYFGNWDWNYGQNPKFQLERHKRFPIGSIDFKLNVENGKIEAIRIFGDFFGKGDISDVENALKGVEYNKEDLLKAFQTIDANYYFGDVTNEELVDLIY
jgi:lipoate-protein ligase A